MTLRVIETDPLPRFIPEYSTNYFCAAIESRRAGGYTPLDSRHTLERRRTMLMAYEIWKPAFDRMLALADVTVSHSEDLYLWAIGMTPGDAAVEVCRRREAAFGCLVVNA